MKGIGAEEKKESVILSTIIGITTICLIDTNCKSNLPNISIPFYGFDLINF